MASRTWVLQCLGIFLQHFPLLNLVSYLSLHLPVSPPAFNNTVLLILNPPPSLKNDLNLGFRYMSVILSTYVDRWTSTEHWTDQLVSLALPHELKVMCMFSHCSNTLWLCSSFLYNNAKQWVPYTLSAFYILLRSVRKLLVSGYVFLLFYNATSSLTDSSTTTRSIPSYFYSMIFWKQTRKIS